MKFEYEKHKVKLRHCHSPHILFNLEKRSGGESCSEEKEEVEEETEGETSETGEARESDPCCHFKEEIIKQYK